MKKIFLFYFLAAISLFPQFLFAQQTLKGQVLDLVSNQPIEAANVFIPNTQIGTTTDENGNFTLQNLPIGENYELVVSHLAYKTFKQLLHKNEQDEILQINLKPKAVDLEAIDIVGIQEKKWKRYFKRFEKAFLGNGGNRSKTTILNPDVLDFEVIKGGELKATASDLLQIENKSTGYKINFLLEKFQTKGEGVSYAGKPFFEALQPENEKMSKQWKKNREKTFNGSLRHFLRALMRDELKEEGFEMYHSSLVNQQNFVTKSSARVSQVLENGDTFNEKYLTIKDFLKVVYTREEVKLGLNEGSVGRMSSQLGQSAEREMIQQGQQDAGRENSRNYQTSYLFSRKSKVRLDTVGIIAEAGLVKEYGYWVDERVADLLPLEYVPNAAFKEGKNSKSKQNHEDKMTNAPNLLGFELSNLRIPLEEILKGGPPKDGIPAIENPKYVKGEEADFLSPEDRVLALEINGEAKAYPLRILDRHEIVNEADFVVSYCPLCNSGSAFKALANGQASTFGVSGLLYNSDVLMYDRTTESLWSQIKGEAISGTASGQKLELLPVVHTTWADWKTRHPNTWVLSTETGHERNYSKTAYTDYRNSEKLMFPVSSVNREMGNKTLVLGVEVDGQFKAYPFPRLKQKTKKGLDLVEDTFNDQTLQIHFDADQNTAYATDREGNLWKNAITLYWFAWYAFHPQTEIFE